MTAKNSSFAWGENPSTSLATVLMISGSGVLAFSLMDSRIISRVRASISGTLASIFMRSPSSVT